MKKRAAVLLLFSCLLAGCAGKPTDAPKEPEEKETEVKEPETKDSESVESESPEEATEPVAEAEPETPYTKTKFRINDARNDTTGKWKVTVINEPYDINDYAKEYFDDHVGDGEIHAVVNFANNTTSKISSVGGLINVTTHEYVEDEEHDANMLFSGMTLTDRYFDPETGEEVNFGE